MSHRRQIDSYIKRSWEECGYPSGFRLGDFLCPLKLSAAIPDDDYYRMQALREIGGIYMSLSLLAAFGPRPRKSLKSRQAIMSQGAQVASHVVSIMRLMQNGLDVQARIIARSCIESSDLLVLCQVDEDIAQEFVDCGSAEEANAFWYKRCAKSKVEKAISDYVVEVAPGMERPRRGYLAWRSHESKAMGWAVHPSHMSGSASLLEWDTNLNDVTDAALERPWSRMSERTLDYLISALGSALGDLNLVVFHRFGGLDKHLKLPRKRLPDDTKRYFEIGQKHLLAVHRLSDPSLLGAQDLTGELRRRLRLMRQAAV